MGTAANVILDDIQGIFYAAVATSGVTATGTLGGSVTTTGWTDTGYVDAKGKIKLTFGGNANDVRPIGMEGNLKRFMTDRMATIEFMGLEDTATLLARALAGGAVGSNAIPDGGAGEVAYAALTIITTNFVYWFKKCAPKAETVKEINDTEAAMIPFVLETFVEEAATAGERIWKILERTGA